LGGWLLLERWMTPDLFEQVAPEAQDEKSFMRLGGDHARNAVTLHRSTFITEADFKWMASFGGIDVVRLPIGYWCMEEHAYGTPFMPTRPYVDSALEWAQAYGLKVVLDCHGMCGSQNGKDHSGDKSQGVQWLAGPNWAKNLQVLQTWAIRWGRHPALLGFGLGNEVEEPAGLESSSAQSVWYQLWSSMTNLTIDCAPQRSRRRSALDSTAYWDLVLSFYEHATDLVRPHLHYGVAIVVDTCWDMTRWEAGRLNNLSEGGLLWLDYHHYQCFEENRTNDMDTHMEAEELLNAIGDQDTGISVILGEFSLGLSPEAPGYHETNGWQEKYYEKQVEHAANYAIGHFFWNYKLTREDYTEWNYRRCVDSGIIRPQRAAHPRVASFGNEVKLRSYSNASTRADSREYHYSHAGA
jgi:glucan 1,3-beta-glucosidase